MTLHPQIIEKDGRKEFVVLPYGEYLQVQEALEDLEDLRLLRSEKARFGDEPTISLTEARERLAADGS